MEQNRNGTETGPPSCFLSPKNPGEDLMSDADWEWVAACLRLTPREREVAELLVAGLSRSQLARRLRRAPGTVRVYIDRLFRKLDVRDRVGLVLRILRVHISHLLSPISDLAAHKDATDR
jgi:DNA-binding NarL/FixJ family response regulator